MSFLPLADNWPLTVVVALLVAAVLVVAGCWAWGLAGLPTREERAMTLPGDDLLAGDRKARVQEAITIKAPPERVWPYLAQIGQRRAGFYALGWLERLFTFHIYNTLEVVDEWQNMYKGEYVFYHQNGIGSEVQDVVPGRYFTMLSDSRRPSTVQGSIAWKPPLGLKHFAWTWNFVLLDNGDGTTRFIQRCDASWTPWGGWRMAVMALLLGSPSVFMVRCMLRSIRRCAEGRAGRPVVDRILGFGAPRAGDPRKG